MTEPVNVHLTPTDQQLVAFLRRQPNGVSSPHAIATELNLAGEAVRTTLAKLERLGVVDRGHTLEGHEEVILNPTALGDEAHGAP